MVQYWTIHKRKLKYPLNRLDWSLPEVAVTDFSGTVLGVESDQRALLLHLTGGNKELFWSDELQWTWTLSISFITAEGKLDPLSERNSYEVEWPHNINIYFLKRSTNWRIGNGERGMVIGPLGSLLTLFTRSTELCCLFRCQVIRNSLRL